MGRGGHPRQASGSPKSGLRGQPQEHGHGATKAGRGTTDMTYSRYGGVCRGQSTPRPDDQHDIDPFCLIERRQLVDAVEKGFEGRLRAILIQNERRARKID